MRRNYRLHGSKDAKNLQLPRRPGAVKIQAPQAICRIPEGGCRIPEGGCHHRTENLFV